jgi:pimeloyl-ACP methyl ester carboxylesterase
MVDGVSTFFRRVPGEGPPVVFVHGNPTHSEDWQPFLERTQGPALAFDLPGWGRSGRPSPAEFDYSMNGLARFVKRFLQRMAVDRHSLVVHDWGAVALIAAQDDPGRIRRLAIVNAVPLLPGYRGIARRASGGRVAWASSRTRLWTRWAMDFGLRESRGDRSRHDPAFVDMIWEHLDRGTLAAVLRLYRSADPDRLAAAGERLDRLRRRAWSSGVAAIATFPRCSVVPMPRGYRMRSSVSSQTPVTGPGSMSPRWSIAWSGSWPSTKTSGVRDEDHSRRVRERCYHLVTRILPLCVP